MYNYTIIIPYRDKYDLLCKAVDSVPDREDIQVIIIDNSEKPLPQARVPQKNQTTVLFLTSDPTKGAGCARNVGLQHISGKYTIFLDADDYFTSEAFPAFDRYLEKEYDIVFFDADSVKLSNGTHSTRHEKIHRYITNYLKNHKDDYLRYHFGNPICKMFRSEFLKEGGYQFQEVKVSNDMMFSVTTGHYAKTVTADPSVVYMITEADKGQSLVKSKTAINQYTRFTVLVEYNAFLKSVNRADMYYKLSSATLQALIHFGPLWFFRYIKYAHKHGLKVFSRS